MDDADRVHVLREMVEAETRALGKAKELAKLMRARCARHCPAMADRACRLHELIAACEELLDRDFVPDVVNADKRKREGLRDVDG